MPPIIIDQPGMYLTRGGKTIQIRDITHVARGTWRKGSRARRNHDIWHVSGRYIPSRETPHDIISKL